MGSRLRSSRPTCRVTSTSSGIGCRQGATFLRRCGGRHSESERRYASVGHSNGGRPHRSGGCSPLSGADTGAEVSPRLLRLPTRQICDRCGAHGSRTLLATRLGDRSRHQGLLRQHRLGADAKGCPPTYGLSVGDALRRALAEGAGADGGRQHRAAHGGNAAGWGDLAPCWRTYSCITRSTRG